MALLAVALGAPSVSRQADATPEASVAPAPVLVLDDAGNPVTEDGKNVYKDPVTGETSTDPGTLSPNAPIVPVVPVDGDTTNPAGEDGDNGDDADASISPEASGEEEEEEKGGGNTGKIVGGIVGGAAGLLLLGAGAAFLAGAGKKKDDDEEKVDIVNYGGGGQPEAHPVAVHEGVDVVGTA